MNRMTVVYHMATPRSDGRIAVTRVGKVCRDGVVVSTMTHSVTLTPHVARLMAEAMRDEDFGKFRKEDGDQSVGVWLEEVTWKREDGVEVREYINCLPEGGDGWSWEFAQALDEAADEAEVSE